MSLQAWVYIRWRELIQKGAIAMNVDWQRWEAFRDLLLSDGGVQHIAEEYDCIVGGLELTRDIGVEDELAIDENGRCVEGNGPPEFPNLLYCLETRRMAWTAPRPRCISKG